MSVLLERIRLYFLILASFFYPIPLYRVLVLRILCNIFSNKMLFSHLKKEKAISQQNNYDFNGDFYWKIVTFAILLSQKLILLLFT